MKSAITKVFFAVPPECATGTPPLTLAFERAAGDEARTMSAERCPRALRWPGLSAAAAARYRPMC